MTPTKREPLGSRRGWLIAVLAVVCVVVVAAFAFAIISGAARGDAASADPVELSLEALPTSQTASSVVPEGVGTTRVEVPSVVGKPVAEAEALLVAAGFSVERRETAQVLPVGADVLVAAQEPAAGLVVEAGSTVLLRIPSVARTTAVSSADMLVVCIDPGHQGSSDLKPEPIGPGASETKERVLGGTTGVATKLPEYEVTLQISMNLKKRLEAVGVKVVMTREVNDVSISNAERAQLANAAGADLFVRIHCDGSTDSQSSGISTLYPGSNQWTGAITGPSKAAAASVQSAVIASTGAVSRGTVARTDLTGFNWSKVPALVIECGFMTNPVEDRLLASPHYQDKLAEGIKNGIMAYLEGE